MKTVFRAILCTVLAAVALTMALFTAAGFRRAEAARAPRGMPAIAATRP